MSGSDASPRGGRGATPSQNARPDSRLDQPPEPASGGIPAPGKTPMDAEYREPTAGTRQMGRREMSKKEAVDEAVEASDRSFTKGLDDKRERDRAYK